MRDVESYAVTAEGEEELNGAVRRVKQWIDELPKTAKVSISLRVKVKDVAEHTGKSKTSDMFEEGEVKNGVQRKRRRSSEAEEAAGE
jgi:hypothetical protein